MGSKLRTAAQLLAVALLIATAVALPWVRYRVSGDGHAHSIGAGPYTVVLIAVGAVAGLLALAALRIGKRWLAYSAAVVGVVTVALSVITAATRMSHANDLTINAGGTTTWSWGTLAAIIAGAALTVLPVLGSVAPNRSSTIGR